MPNLTDELMGKTSEGAKKAVEASAKVLKEAKGELKEAEESIKGICLLLIKGTSFTADTVMSAVKNVAFKTTGDIRFSKNNIDISELRKTGHVYAVEENILQDAMKYFDKHCKECGVKYSAMKDTRGEGNPNYKPTYMVFFEGKDTDLILHVLQEAYKDYAKEQQKDKEAEKSGRDTDMPEKNQKRGKRQKGNQEQPEKRESVKAKLAFFRDRVAARDKEQDAVEKHHQHDDIQR
ncbi:MAG: PcfB family protein [Lachnospiraceae bacterium]|nr:PcfB family protein [Lachnospiraceae bacterium]